jgi:glyoxalase family protein
MNQTLPGLHHVTAVAGAAQRAIGFYAGVLGLRLVKVTVNFDDPWTYHLYFGDGLGTPGSLITFFAWGDAPAGRQGNGQANLVSLTIPQASLGYWMERLIGKGVRYQGPAPRFGAQTLALRDPDGLALELVASPAALEAVTWEGTPVPAEHAIRGLHGVTLWHEDPAPTAALLTEEFGFRQVAEEDGVRRFALGDGGPGRVLDLRAAPGFWSGAEGVGTVHHIALRTPDAEQQLEWRSRLAARGLEVTPVRDRRYFESVYAREPGGALLEIATDGPGFTLDEPAESLGSELRLPPWLEAQRAAIRMALPELHLPGAAPDARA